MIIHPTFTHSPALSTAPRVSAPPPAPAASADVSPVQPSPEALQHAVAAINLALQQSNQSIEFSVDSNTHRTVVRMVDTSTGELIRQFPSEATLAISRGIDEFQRGLLLTNKA